MWGLTLLNLFVNLLRGSPDNASIIGIETCGTTSWVILSCFGVFLVLVSLYNVREV